MDRPTTSEPVPSAPTSSSNDTAFRVAAVERKGWQSTMAPQFIALFLWVAYYDQLAVHTLATGGLGPAVAGLAVAGLLCFALLYYVPTMWGFRTGEPLTVITTSTFGRKGANALTGIVFALAQVVWFAVGAYLATELILEGLAACRLLDPRVLHPLALGRRTIPSPLFLIVSAFWCCWAGLVGAYLVRVIAALMRVFPVFPAAMLGLAMVLTINGAVDYLVAAPALAQPLLRGPGLAAFLTMIQLVFGFFATAGLAAADWGAVSREARDVRLGGFVGVVFAPWAIGTMALLIVAGARGAALEAVHGAPAVRTGGFTFHEVLYDNFDGRVTCAIFIVLGLASLAPTTYTSFVIGERLSTAWPRLSRVRWSVCGSAAAWLLIAANVAGRLEEIFSVMGAVFAPMAGAMLGDYLRHQGRWPGPREGVNQAGLVAWVAGLTVGLIPTIGRAWGQPALARIQPAAVLGCVTALVVYLLLALSERVSRPTAATISSSTDGPQGQGNP